MSDREASNYSIQPLYPWPSTPPGRSGMGDLAASDGYQAPNQLPDVGAPLVPSGPQISKGNPVANRITSEALGALFEPAIVHLMASRMSKRQP